VERRREKGLKGGRKERGKVQREKGKGKKPFPEKKYLFL
jgi:hypothetical protein